MTSVSHATAPDTLPPAQFYEWNGYRCAYEVWPAAGAQEEQTPLVLVHPIGVGLSRRFWHRFCREWVQRGETGNPLYNPDLLGCGDSDMPRTAYYPEDWARQLQHFIASEVGRPAILVVQGALFPVAIALARSAPEWVRGLVLSGPPALPVMSNAAKPTQQKLLWNLFFDTPIGRLFYRYARRRKFLESFSERQLFARAEDVDEEWLNLLKAGATDTASRHAVFSFLAGFWRRDYREDMQAIAQPVLVVFGEGASSISREGKQDTTEDRRQDYLQTLPNAEVVIIAGRNVMPYETTAAFVDAIAPFVLKLG